MTNMSSMLPIQAHRITRFFSTLIKVQMNFKNMHLYYWSYFFLAFLENTTVMKTYFEPGMDINRLKQRGKGGGTTSCTAESDTSVLRFSLFVHGADHYFFYYLRKALAGPSCFIPPHE